MTVKYTNNFIQDIIKQDLDAGKHQSIQTRFPPEPNGYLHLGHVKSICLNFGMAQVFSGKCNLRFDDTNPEKESADYMSAIKEDVSWLGFEWANLTYASGYFEQLYDLAVALINMGLAYVDSQSSEQIRQNRGSLTEAGSESPFRARSVTENLDLFTRMRAGEFADGEVALRAKIDMASPNMNMRDPVIYRVRHVHHYRTGDKWCIYPMYDFTHGLSDMIEAVTHSLCTLEFEDHRPLYDWLLEVLDVPCQPRQIEFSRLQVEYTVLSKRRLIQLVDQGFVDGWDDPRMPTIAGMRRRGIPAIALRDFCYKIGINKKNAMIEMNFFEGAIRDHLNESAQRRMAVLDPLKVTISNFPEDTTAQLQVANHPQNESMGKRSVPFSRTLYIEKEDFREEANKKFKRLKLGEEIRLRGAYVIRCQQVIKDEAGNPIELICTYDADTLGKNPTDGRKIKGVIHWVCSQNAVDSSIIQYDRLFTQANPMAAETFTDSINCNSKHLILGAKLEPCLGQSKAGEAFQFERIGYFTRDNKPSDNLVFNQTISLRESQS